MAVTFFPSALDCKITTASSKSVTNRLIMAQYGDGYSMVAPDGLNSNVESWELEIAPMKVGIELTAARAFFNSVGAHQWFVWKPKGETDYKKFRIAKDSLKEKMLNTEEFAYSFTLTQVFDLGIIPEAPPENTLLDSYWSPLTDSNDEYILALD